MYACLLAGRMGFFIVFDVNDRGSFEEVSQFFDFIPSIFIHSIHLFIHSFIYLFTDLFINGRAGW
jgi:hypothetical protein